MSLTAEALQIVIANALTAANTQIETRCQPLAVQPAGVKFHSLEQYQDGRARFRGHFKTHAISDFAAYTQRHAQGRAQQAQGFIDQDAMSAEVLFNLGNHLEAGHGDDTASITLKRTAAFKAVIGILGQPLNQQQVAEFLEDWAPNIQAFDGDDKLAIAQAISGIRKMTLKATSQRDSTVGDFSASQSAMDAIEAASLEQLASRFEFRTPPYEGLSEATLNLRLSVLTGSEKPVLKLRWVGEEAQREAFAQEFKTTLEDALQSALPLTLGSYSQGQ